MYTSELESSSVMRIEWKATPTSPGIERFAHLLQRVAEDPRFTEPARDILGVERVDLFTAKRS